MSQEGETAPAFTLPGFVDGTVRRFDLRDATDAGRAVLLIFFPFDFSPVCTKELCAIRDAEWFGLTPELEVWAISGDSVYAHRAFAEEYDLNFALLSDSGGHAADAYGTKYDEWEGHADVPKRAVILVDSDATIRYVWQTDNALENPDFFPVKKALDELGDAGIGPDGIELVVDYEDGPADSP